MSLSSALSGIFTSLHNLFSSILATILALAQNILHALQSCLSGLVHLVRGVLTQVVRVTGGAGKFIASKSLRMPNGLQPGKTQMDLDDVHILMSMENM